ncbi:MAG TPA: hypothetical protein VM942_00725 [Acidimicrobiales bacterium]|nr:hypothetical protein [Acidimicrobiales bacterium]
MPERDAEIAGRLRALGASPGDPESLRRGLLWVAGEVQAYEEATLQTTEQMAALTNRLAAMEVREQALARATAGIDSFRREFQWLSGEVQARGEALARANGKIDDLVAELSLFRHQAGERIASLEARGSSSADVRGELDRYTAEATGAADFSELAQVARRGGLLEVAVRELRAELENVTHEVLSNHQSTTAHVAGRTAPLEGALHELRREIDRVADEAGANHRAVRDEVTGHVATLDQRLRGLETLQGELDGLYRELDRVSGHMSGGENLLTQVAERIPPMEEALVATHREILDVRDHQAAAATHIAEVTLRVTEMAEEVTRRIDEVEGHIGLQVTETEARVVHRVEAVAGEVDGVGRRIEVVGERIDMVEERVDTVSERVNAVEERLGTLGVLTSDIEGMYRELDRVAELTLARDGALAQIADRTTPLEISVSGLRHELERLAGEVLVAQQAALGDVAARVDAFGTRIDPLELLVDQVAELGHELRRVSEEAGSAQQAALAATTEQLGLAGRLRMLEGLPADIEGMYRDFQRVAESSASRDDRQGEALEREAAVDASIAGLRAELERVAAEGQNTELDLRRRLAGLESLTTDLDSLYRELGRVTALATDQEDRSAAFEATVAGVRDSLAELRERIEDERIYTTEQVTGLWARMRAVEGVPADVERVSTEVEKLAEAVSRAFGDSNESIDDVARRVQALESLPSDIEVVQREIDGLAAAAREREEQIAGLRAQLEPLASALADVRAEFEHVRGEVKSVGETPARLSGIDDRLGQLDGLPDKIDAALRQLDRTSDEMTANHQAALASASFQLQDFSERLQALEALPADMEGLYAALYRVAESVKSLREDAASNAS